MPPAPAPTGLPPSPQSPWGAAGYAGSGGPVAEPAQGNPWVVALTIGLAVLVLALVALGLRAAAGRNDTADVVEVPARRSPVPSTTPSTSNRAPTSPSTSVPGGGSTTSVPKLDTTNPKVTVNDKDGRFQVTVPRTWLNVPTTSLDQNQWQVLGQLPDGELAPTSFTFAVRWEASDGCTLEQCTQKVLQRIDALYPGVNTATTSEKIGAEPSTRLDATTGDQRVVAWIVVKGDRYWVAQLRGPAQGFDEMLTVVLPIVATMSFG